MKKPLVALLAVGLTCAALVVAWVYYWPTAAWRTSVTVINRSGVALTEVDFFCRQGAQEYRRELPRLEPRGRFLVRVDPDVLVGTIGFKLRKKQLWQRVDTDFFPGEQIELTIQKDGSLTESRDP